MKSGPYVWFARFALVGDPVSRVKCFPTSTALFGGLWSAALDGREIAWFELGGHRMTARSLGALNLWLRSGAVWNFRTKRHESVTRAELWGRPEWRRLCGLLRLRFVVRPALQAAA